MRLVYKATQKPVRLGDRHTISGHKLAVNFFDKPHKPSSEGKVSMRVVGQPSAIGPYYYVSVIGAEWIEREDRYNNVGHVCPDTGRIAMTVADACAREDAADRTFYRYSEEAADAGLECWLQLEGIDATMNAEERAYSLDFDTGRSVSVPASAVVYMQRTRAERGASYTVDLESDDGVRVTISGVPDRVTMSAQTYALALMKSQNDWRVTGIDRTHQVEDVRTVNGQDV